MLVYIKLLVTLFKIGKEKKLYTYTIMYLANAGFVTSTGSQLWTTDHLRDSFATYGKRSISKRHFVPPASYHSLHFEPLTWPSLSLN